MMLAVKANLPVEILQLIARSSTYLSIVFGFGIDKDVMFREGGPGVVLMTILQTDADIRCLFTIKKYVTASMAIVKAVLTSDPSIVKRVCLIWESRVSYPGFICSFVNQFSWGMEHIQTKSKSQPWVLNAFYAATGDFKKIDFTIPDPLGMVSDFSYLYNNMYEDLMKHIKDVRKKVEIHLEYSHPWRAVDLISNSIHMIGSMDEMIKKFSDHGYLDEAIELYKKFPDKVTTEPFQLLCSKDPKTIEALKLKGVESDSPLAIAIISKDIKYINAEIAIDEQNVLSQLQRLNAGTYLHDKLDLSLESKMLLLEDNFLTFYPLKYEKICNLDTTNQNYIQLLTRLFLKQPNEQRRLEMIENGIIRDIDIVLDTIIHRKVKNGRLVLLRRFIDIHGLQAFDHVNEYRSLGIGNNDLQNEFWFIKLQKSKCLNLCDYCNDDKLWLLNVCADMKFKGVRTSNVWTLPTIDLKNRTIYYRYTDITYIPTEKIYRVHNDDGYRQNFIDEISSNIDSRLAPCAYFDD